MYADVPPAPPGLIWWEYLPNVPPLPDPATYFGMSNWTNWGWQYDPDYSVPFYSYSDLDQVSIKHMQCNNQFRGSRQEIKAASLPACCYGLHFLMVQDVMLPGMLSNACSAACQWHVYLLHDSLQSV